MLPPQTTFIQVHFIRKKMYRKYFNASFKNSPAFLPGGHVTTFGTNWNTHLNLIVWLVWQAGHEKLLDLEQNCPPDHVNFVLACKRNKTRDSNEINHETKVLDESWPREWTNKLWCAKWLLRYKHASDLKLFFVIKCFFVFFSSIYIFTF